MLHKETPLCRYGCPEHGYPPELMPKYEVGHDGVLTEAELERHARFSIQNKLATYQSIMWEGAWLQHQADQAHEAEVIAEAVSTTLLLHADWVATAVKAEQERVLAKVADMVRRINDGGSANPNWNGETRRFNTLPEGLQAVLEELEYCK